MDAPCAIKPRMEKWEETTKTLGHNGVPRRFCDGDRVVVYRKPGPAEESSWNNCWTEEMEASLGSTGTVSYQSGKREYCLTFSEDHILDGYYYPEDCLRKVCD